MNLMVNSLPTRTWNRLGMNETKVTVEGEFHNHIPKAQYDPAEVLWTEDAAQGTVPSGVPLELQELVSEAKVSFAETKPGVQMNAPLMLNYCYPREQNSASRLVLHAAKNSTLKVVMLLNSECPDGGETAAVQTEVYADKDAVVDLYVVQLMGAESVCMYNLSGTCQDRARVNLTKLELGAGRLYAGAVLDLIGKESMFNTEIGYHAKKGQVLDMNYVALHRGMNTRSLMEASGTLEDKSKKIFRGTIDFQQGCSGAKGTENENVLLLGDSMINQTIPLILCAEEDVEGNHGASIGRLDEKVLFYLSSRGISEQEAQQMIAQSRIEAICSKLPDEAIRSQVHEFEIQRGISNEREFQD